MLVEFNRSKTGLNALLAAVDRLDNTKRSLEEAAKLIDQLDITRHTLLKAAEDLKENSADMADRATAQSAELGPTSKAVLDKEHGLITALDGFKQYEMIRDTWRKVRDAIDGIIENIKDGRVRNAYYNTSAHNYEERINKLVASGLLKQAQADPAIRINQLLLFWKSKDKSEIQEADVQNLKAWEIAFDEATSQGSKVGA